MSVLPALDVALYPRESQQSRFYFRWSAITISEGDAIKLSVSCSNPAIGAKVRLWWYGSCGASVWATPWQTAMQEAVKDTGLIYTPDPSSYTRANNLGNFSGVFEVGPGYVDAVAVINNRARKNRKDDVPLNPDGSAPSKGFCSLSTNAATTTALVTLTPSYQIAILDTSRTPAGAPILRLRLRDEDGVTQAKAQYAEGEDFQMVITTENIVPGTKCKVFIANVGQSRFDPPFRSAIIAALKARPDLAFTYASFPTPPGESFYHGATIEFLDTYDESQPIRVPLHVELNDIEEPGQTVDFIPTIVAEGDLLDFAATADRGIWANTATYRNGDQVNWLDDGANYVYIASGATSGHKPSDPAYWSTWRKTINGGAASTSVRDVLPRYWEIRATSDGSTIRYALHVPSAPDIVSSVVITSGGNEPAGYEQALNAALAANPGIVTFEGGRFHAHAVSQVNAELVWTVAHPSAPGKHTLRLSDIAGSSPAWIVIADAVVYLTRGALPADPSFVTGVNICGGEFGRNGTGGGDVYGTNYRYPHRIERSDPSQRHQSMDYYWSRGARLFRFPVLWGRIQDDLFGPLTRNDAPVNSADRADMWRIDDCINYWTNVLGGWCVLDIHNFGSGPNGGGVRFDPDLAARGVSIEALSDLWVKLAQRYESNPKVHLGLMNEPNSSGHSPTRNRDNMQAVTNAIRARTNSLAKIYVAGCEYSSAQNWVSNGNADALETYYDPADNYVFEAHSYFDADGAGQKPACSANTRTRLVNATQWAKTHGRKLFLGEFGSGDPKVSGQTQCGVELPGALAYMKANKDAWYGWTSYFGGDMWGAAFAFTIDPVNPYVEPIQDNERMKMLLPYFEVNP